MIKSVVNKLLNRETINYLVFGVLTTLVNLISYKICTLFSLDYKVSTVISWALSVSFAYITNKLFVFESKSFEKSLIIKEISTFIFSRLFSGLGDLIFMVVAVDLIHMDDFIAKICTNIFVVIINYILSKLIVFKER